MGWVGATLSEEAHPPSRSQFCSGNNLLRVSPGQTGPPGEKGRGEGGSAVMHAHPCTHTCTCIPVHTHLHRHTHARTPVHAHLHTHTHAHTRARTPAHTYPCTHTHAASTSPRDSRHIATEGWARTEAQAGGRGHAWDGPSSEGRDACGQRRGSGPFSWARRSHPPL